MYRVPPSACTIAVATGIRREEAPSAVLAREGEKCSGHFSPKPISKCVCELISFVSLILTAKTSEPLRKNRSAFTPRETIAGRQRVRRESARGPTTAADRRQRTPVGQVGKRTLTTNQHRSRRLYCLRGHACAGARSIRCGCSFCLRSLLLPGASECRTRHIAVLVRQARAARRRTT